MDMRGENICGWIECIKYVVKLVCVLLLISLLLFPGGWVESKVITHKELKWNRVLKTMQSVHSSPCWYLFSLWFFLNFFLSWWFLLLVSSLLWFICQPISIHSIYSIICVQQRAIGILKDFMEAHLCFKTSLYNVHRKIHTQICTIAILQKKKKKKSCGCWEATCHQTIAVCLGVTAVTAWHSAVCQNYVCRRAASMLQATGVNLCWGHQPCNSFFQLN